ncbi:hypothetical protein ACGFSB_02685 [Streptomyces sp. NPDC048441]|uniref:hypothetical protein n=1 Tax=Streptomyces sp. NPDC048441 TaxID=3365552 RepID=UPI0037103959
MRRLQRLCLRAADQPAEITQYLETFERLRRMAVYGVAARALIVKAIEALHRPGSGGGARVP